MRYIIYGTALKPRLSDEDWESMSGAEKNGLGKIPFYLIVHPWYSLWDGGNPGERDYRDKTNGSVVRVTDYQMREVAGAEPVYRLLTTIVDLAEAPAPELARLYQERLEVETALDELKTHLRGSHIVLHSKTPNLVRQEFYGLMMAHFAVRNWIHEAAMKAGKS